MSHKKNLPPHSFHEMAKTKTFDWNQAVNVSIWALKLSIITWAPLTICYLLEPGSSGQSMHCIVLHFLVSFSVEVRSLPLEWILQPTVI